MLLEIFLLSKRWFCLNLKLMSFSSLPEHLTLIMNNNVFLLATLVCLITVILGEKDQGSCEVKENCIGKKLSCLDIDPRLNEMDQEDPELIKIIKEKYLISPPENPGDLSLPKDEDINMEGQFGQVNVINKEYFGVRTFWSTFEMSLCDLITLLIQNGKFERGFFVEAGAADGYTISNTLYFEMKKKWTGLLVEADPGAFEKLKKIKRNAWIIHTCLSTKTHPEIVEFDVAGIVGGIINEGVKHSDFYVSSSSWTTIVEGLYLIDLCSLKVTCEMKRSGNVHRSRSQQLRLDWFWSVSGLDLFIHPWSKIRILSDLICYLAVPWNLRVIKGTTRVMMGAKPFHYFCVFWSVLIISFARYVYLY